MLSILFLLSVWLNGMLILRLIKQSHRTLPFSFIIGSLVTVTPIFLVTSYVTRNLSLTMMLYALGMLPLYGLCVYRRFYLNSLWRVDEFVVFICMVVFGWYVFTKGFSYDATTHTFLISSNTYMDFGAHIPLIRSFSMGNNFPTTLPFFATSGGTYYFLTDFFAGVLEFLGIRIDFAINSISTLAFAGVGTALYSMTYGIWKSKMLGVLAILIFFSSNSFEWLQFITDHSNPVTWFGSIYHMSNYSPVVEVFWNLNTYLNQRQLLFGIAAFCWFLYRRMQEKKYVTSVEQVLDGILLGCLSYWHMHVFLASSLLFFLTGTRSMLSLGLSVLIALPQLYSIFVHSTTHIALSPGFIVTPVTISSWVLFWIKNTGILIPLSCVGMVLAGKRYRMVSIFTFILFVIPNIFHISVRNVFDDHKFFLIWKVCMTLFALFALFSLRKRAWIYLGVFILIVSGCINFFVIKNDVKARIADYVYHPLLQKLSSSISSQEVVITNGEIYDPANISGLKTLTGRAQYSYVYGGTPDPALKLQSDVLSGTGPDLRNREISYVVCYSDSSVPNLKQCAADALTKRYTLVYTDGLGSVWKTK